MNGLVNSRAEAISHLDRRIETESDVIPVAYKAGIIQEAKSSVANEKRFLAMTGFVNQKIKAMGREILDGRITVDPYKKGEKTLYIYRKQVYNTRKLFHKDRCISAGDG